MFTISFSYPQLDVIFFKDGRSEKGDVSINGQNVTLKPKFGDKVKFYNTDFINTIKFYQCFLLPSNTQTKYKPNGPALTLWKTPSSIKTTSPCVMYILLSSNHIVPEPSKK